MLSLAVRKGTGGLLPWMLTAIWMLGVIPGLAQEGYLPPPPLNGDRYFPPDAVVDVTKPPYHAIPDDGQDDTAALQQVITDNVGSGRVLYFPPGVYEISDTLVAKNAEGKWRPHLTLQGQNRTKTIIRLIDHAPGFDQPEKPKAMIMTGSMEEKGDSADGGGNKAFRNNLFDLTIDSGHGNPGAIGLEYAVSNQGAVENVTFRSGDGSGAAGIAMKRRIPGPGLVKDVSVEGFDVGLDIGDGQYGLTVEDLFLKGQRVAGIRDSENVLQIRHYRYSASGAHTPALLITGRNGVATLLDSSLSQNVLTNADLDAAQPRISPPTAAVIESSGSLFLRDVTVPVFGSARHVLSHRKEFVPTEKDGGRVEALRFSQFADPPPVGENEAKIVTLDQAPVGSNGLSDAKASSFGLLPIEETPSFDTAPSEWIAVGERREGEKDDTKAIQRAVDSGKAIVYLNRREYFISDTVILRGHFAKFMGMGAEISLGAAKEPFSDREHPRPLFRFDPVDHASPVCFENTFFNAQYPGEIIFENNTASTVVLKHLGGWVGMGSDRRSYRNTARATGKVFIEDCFLPGWEFTRQTIWARQLNPENPAGQSPQIVNQGGKLWILGLKTEGTAPFIATTGGGTTELLGAYNYISATEAASVPADAVPYICEDSTMALTFTTDNFRDDDYRNYIRVTTKGRDRLWTAQDLWPRNGVSGDRSRVVTLFRSDAAPPLPAKTD